VILLISVIVYGFRQGGRVEHPNRDGAGNDPGFFPPADQFPPDHHG
jgi:hypothetical protein